MGPTRVGGASNAITTSTNWRTCRNGCSSRRHRWRSARSGPDGNADDRVFNASEHLADNVRLQAYSRLFFVNPATQRTFESTFSVAFVESVIRKRYLRPADIFKAARKIWGVPTDGKLRGQSLVQFSVDADVERVVRVIRRCQSEFVPAKEVFDFLATHIRNDWLKEQYKGCAESLPLILKATRGSNGLQITTLQKFKKERITAKDAHALKEGQSGYTHPKFETCDLRHIVGRHTYRFVDSAIYKATPVADTTSFFPETATEAGVLAYVRRAIDAVPNTKESGGKKTIRRNESGLDFDCHLGFQGKLANQFYPLKTTGVEELKRPQLLAICDILQCASGGPLATMAQPIF